MLGSRTASVRLGLLLISVAACGADRDTSVSAPGTTASTPTRIPPPAPTSAATPTPAASPTYDAVPEAPSQPPGTRIAIDGRDFGLLQAPEAEELVLLHARTGAQLLRETVERHDSGGYGGFALRSLRIDAHGSEITLHGTHQARLPERRKRCLRPKPSPVSYRLDGMCFIKQASLEVSVVAASSVQRA